MPGFALGNCSWLSKDREKRPTALDSELKMASILAIFRGRPNE